MRCAGRALVAVCFILCCGVAAAEPTSLWWPFDHHNEATTTQPQGLGQSTAPVPALPPSAMGPVHHEVMMPQTGSTAASEDSSWFHLPHWHPFGSYATKPQPNPQRNAWATRNAPPKAPASPLQSVKNGAHKVVAGTKAAYHKTVAALTPGSTTPKPPSATHVARGNAEPSFWKRMFGAKEPVRQPSTIPDFLAQKRLDP